MVNNKNMIHYYWAYSYYELDKYEDTIEILNEIIDYDLEIISEDHYIEINSLMANAYYCLADYKKAIEFYTRSLMVSVSNETIYGLKSKIALCYEEEGQIEMAIEFNLKCLELLDLNNDTPQISLIYFRIGSCYENIQKYEMSISYYKKGFDLDAKDYFLFRIANCYEALGNYTESFEFNLQFFNLYQEYFESNQDKSDFEKMIQKTKHWARDLGRENELPDWMT
jgi:tetratricopeptide (TPR) repeat protein